MNVFMISGGYPSKTNPQNGVFAFDQAKAINEYTNCNVFFGVLDLRSFLNKRKYGVFFDSVDNVEITVCSFPLGAVPETIYEEIGKRLFRILFKKMVKRYGVPDIIHAQFGNMGIIVNKLATKKGIPVVVTEHASSLNNDSWDKTTKRKYSMLYKKVAATICVSNALKKNIQLNTGCNPLVIPNIVDLRSFKYSPDKPHDPFTFICVANLVDIKNHDLLLRAFKQFCDSKLGVKTKLLIVGDGPNRQRLEAQVSSSGLNNVQFFGRLARNEISSLFEVSDAFILTSKSETFGVAFLEALASGLPVISTACGGPLDFITNDCGIVVREDENEICKALATIIEKYNKYDRAIFSKLFREKYSPNLISRTIYSVYEKIVIG